MTLPVPPPFRVRHSTVQDSLLQYTASIYSNLLGLCAVTVLNYRFGSVRLSATARHYNLYLFLFLLLYQARHHHSPRRCVRARSSYRGSYCNSISTASSMLVGRQNLYACGVSYQNRSLIYNVDFDAPFFTAANRWIPLPQVWSRVAACQWPGLSLRNLLRLLPRVCGPWATRSTSCASAPLRIFLVHSPY